jgi:hypothetical protein
MNTLLSGNVEKTVYCQIDLDEAKVKHFKDAIENNYWLEFFMGMFCIISCDCYSEKLYNDYSFKKC